MVVLADHLHFEMESVLHLSDVVTFVGCVQRNAFCIIRAFHLIKLSELNEQVDKPSLVTKPEPDGNRLTLGPRVSALPGKLSERRLVSKLWSSRKFTSLIRL